MMKYCQKINFQEPQRNRNATAIFVNLIWTSTVGALDVYGCVAHSITTHKQTQ